MSINNILGITESYKAPERMWEICELGNDEVENLTEIKILTEEYGFAVKPLAFPNL